MHGIDQFGLWIFFGSEMFILAMIVLHQVYGHADWANALALLWSVGTLGGYLTTKWWR